MLVVATGQYSGHGPSIVVQEALDIILEGLDGTKCRISQSQSSERQARLNINVSNGLVHQTGRQGARGIITSGRMNKGQSGIAAGGIYFATNGSDTMHKAHWHGFLFTLRVRLGNVQEWSASKTDPTVTFQSLQSLGYDSVHIPRAGGDEYIVYHSDQVELQTIQLVALPAHYPHDKANPGFFSHGTPCTLIGPAFKTSHLEKNPRALDAFLKFDAVGAAQLLSGGSYHSTGGHHSTAATGGGVSYGKPVCKYAPRCYRTSTDHWRDYDHPGQHAPVPKPW